MRTTQDHTDSSAAAAPEAEARAWADLAARWRQADHPDLWADLPGTEAAIVRFFDPVTDIDRRARVWAYQPVTYDFSDLSRFSAGLALAEADAWREDRPHIATKAYEDRRFLISDRLIHWAVPWLDAVARRAGAEAADAEAAKSSLLEIGDRLRLAPALVGSEGLVVPGFDAFGPFDSGAGLAKTLPSLWSGAVLSGQDLGAIRHAVVTAREVPVDWLQSADTRKLLAAFYRDSAGRWDTLAAHHAGTAQLWRDLSHRAERTAQMLNA